MKNALTLETIDSQHALALPDRNMLALVTVVITDVLQNILVNVEVRNNNVAVQVCAIVELLDNSLGTDLTCTINQ